MDINWIVVHQFDGGSSVFGIKSHAQSLEELFNWVIGNATEQQLSSVEEFDSDNMAPLLISNKLGIDFDPSCENLIFVPFNASELECISIKG